MPRRTVATLATATVALTVVSVLVAAPGASADLVTHCVGTGGAVTVPNDLYVPEGRSCVLTGTTVTGDVRVGAGANLVVSGGHVRGEVMVAADGYLDATATSVDGAVVLAAGGYGVFLRHTRTGPVTVQPKGTSTIDSFLFVEETTIAGDVAADAGEVRLDRTTQVEGNVGSTGTYYTDVHDSFVDGTLSVRGSATGSVVCGSAVRGTATFTANAGGVQLGPNGNLDGCASGGYWGRDVDITGTAGGVTVDDNIIDGRLTTTANSPAARVAPTNRVRGGITGEWSATTLSRTARTRANGGGQRAQARRSSAVRAADATGTARL